jgi:hypothetical protein
LDRFRKIFLGVSASAGVVLAGCGGSDNKEAKTVTETNPSTETASTPTETTKSKSSSGGDPLTGISPPAGSKKLSSKDKGGTQWLRYSTSKSPASVVSSYKSELSSAGWSLVHAGAAGGGWGPYGGSGAGLTAKKSSNFFDVQAGAAKGGTTYFEVCAGGSARNACDALSTSGDSKSGGSHPGGDDPSTSSGAS